jgi:hypothetical protein
LRTATSIVVKPAAAGVAFFLAMEVLAYAAGRGWPGSSS